MKSNTHWKNRRHLTLMIFTLACTAVPLKSAAVGGSGGHSFTIQCTGSERLAAVITNSGRRIDGVGIACINQAGQWRQQWAGNSSTASSSNFSTVNIAPARWVDQVDISIGKCGKKTTRVCGLAFHLDTGFIHSSGNRTNDTRAQQAPRNQELFGFRGRAGREIDNLDALYRPRQRPAFNQARRIPAQQIADAIDVLFAEFVMRLHNITSRTGNSWHDPDGSFVRIAGVEEPIPINEFSYRRPKGTRRYFYYANEINARPGGTRIQFEPGRGAFIMRILLEDDGVEMKGKCRRKRANGNYTACSGRHEGDGKAPDVQWSYPEIELTLVPQIVQRPNRRNGVGLRVENVRLKGDFNLNGICGKLGSECHTILNGWKGRLITGTEAGVTTAINGRDVQRQMAQVTRRILNADGIPNLVDVVIDGNDVELRW